MTTHQFEQAVNEPRTLTVPRKRMEWLTHELIRLHNHGLRGGGTSYAGMPSLLAVLEAIPEDCKPTVYNGVD